MSDEDAVRQRGEPAPRKCTMPSRGRQRRPLPAPAVFRREGEYWTIAYDGAVVRLRDAKGLHYVAYLLGHPGREVYVADLQGTAAVRPRQNGADPLDDAAASAERARKAVTNRIKETLARICTEHRPLGLHLANSIRTGLFCRYTPERPTAWTL